MSVDMYPRRFIAELNKFDEFKPQGTRCEEVWKEKFPAWRALFASLCFYGHSTNYRLFSYDRFYRYCERAYAEQHTDETKRSIYCRYFDPQNARLLEGMKERISVWYEAGMAETYLYAYLVDRIEDKMKVGAVLYDPRVDWKLKSDLVVIIKGQIVRVSAFTGNPEKRVQIEHARDQIEHERKANTMESSHWGNAFFDKIPKEEIHLDENNCQKINGIRVFDNASIDDLLERIYKRVQIAPQIAGAGMSKNDLGQ